MDRNNIPNAAIAGMLVDLNITTGPGYNLSNMSFFITYILFQPLMIVVCRKMGPRIFLPMVCLMWGGVIIGFGFARNWPTLVPLRLILGVLEAGYFPGSFYCCHGVRRGRKLTSQAVCTFSHAGTHAVSLRSSFYGHTDSAQSRWHADTRYFTSLGALPQLLVVFLHTGSSRWTESMALKDGDGKPVRKVPCTLSKSCRIFIMEGVITCGIAIFAAIFLVKFPDEERKKPSVRFLSSDKLNILINRLNADRGDVDPEPFTLKRFLQPATEWYIYGFPIILL